MKQSKHTPNVHITQQVNQETLKKTMKIKEFGK